MFTNWSELTVHTVKVTIKSTFRKKTYSIAILAFFILTAILLLSYYHPDISVMEYLSFSMRLGQIGLSFFVFFCYECLSYISRTENTEAIATQAKEKNRLIFSQIGIFIMILTGWVISILLCQLGIYLLSSVKYFPYIQHVILSVLLNCFLPGLIAILLGTVLALSAKRTYAYCIILVFIILTSSIPSKILYAIEIDGVSILTYFDVLAILMPNSDFVADSVYGTSIEIHRWALALGWISLLILCLLIRMRSASFLPRKLMILMFVLTIICGMRFESRLDDSIVRKDYRSDGTLFSELTYRSQNLNISEKKPSFQICEYFMDITINSKMHVSATIKPEQTELDTYDFTLWHSLNIINITDKDGNDYSYDRNGDYLTVYSPNGVDEIHINYEGNCGKYFSNYQGIALPGYIPYYPWPGHRNVWDYQSQEINVLQDLTESHVYISVNSNLDVFCNLPKVSNNTFEGTTKAVSIYAGLLSETNIEGQICYRSPVAYQRSIIDGYKEQWYVLSEMLGETRDLSLNEKTIFIQPETIMATKSNQEELVIYDDHVILGSWSLSAEAICRNYLFGLLPESDEISLLKNLFKQHIAFGSNGDCYEKPELDDLLILTEYNYANEIQNADEWQEYMDAKEVFEHLWNYQVMLLGENTVLKATYQYLISTDRCQNQVDFLYALGDENAND